VLTLVFDQIILDAPAIIGSYDSHAKTWTWFQSEP